MWHKVTVLAGSIVAVLGFLLVSTDCSRKHEASRGEDSVEAADDVAGPELARNPGFEEPASGVPTGWTQDVKKTGTKGVVSRDTSKFHGGLASVRMQPNGHNDNSNPLAISQLIPAGAYRGKTVRFSGFLAAEGGTTAVLGMLAIVNGRPQNLELLFQGSNAGPDWS